MQDPAQMRKKYTTEVSNLAMSNAPENDIEPLLESAVTGPFWARYY